MAKKLKLTEQASYMLGIYSHSPQEPSASVAAESGSEAAIEKFSYIALNELGIEPNKILVSQGEGTYRALFYNSKIRKLFGKALERKTKLFKYENAYAAQYVAGMFDAVGGVNARGLFLSGIDAGDSVILENLQLHTMQQGSKHYISNHTRFTAFVKKYSAKLPNLESQHR
jgi:hypothetical protein